MEYAKNEKQAILRLIAEVIAEGEITNTGGFYLSLISIRLEVSDTDKLEARNLSLQQSLNILKQLCNDGKKGVKDFLEMVVTFEKSNSDSKAKKIKLLLSEINY